MAFAVFPGREKGFDVRGRHKLGAALAGAVGVMPAHGVVFTIAPDPLVIAIAFVAGDDDDGARGRAMAAGLKHPGRAQNIGVEGCQRILVRRAHQREGRHMDDHLGREFPQRLFQRGIVVDVRMPAVDQLVQAQAPEHGRRARRIQGNPHDFRSQHVQPHGEPASLEARMPGDEYAPAVIKLFQHGLKMHKNLPVRLVPRGRITGPAPE